MNKKRLLAVLAVISIVICCGTGLAQPPQLPLQMQMLDDKNIEGEYVIPILLVNYYPIKDGYIDINETRGEWGGKTLGETKQKVERLTWDTIIALQKGSRYHYYKNPRAKPSIVYKVLDTKEFLKPVPRRKRKGGTGYIADYIKIMREINIKYWVERRGVKEVWIWAYPDVKTQMWESNMAGPYGDISNSNRDPHDLPVLSKTYTVYYYNYARGVSEAVEDHMHQIESIFRHIDHDLFWKKFVGYFPSGKWWKSDPNIPKDRRCGWCHYPPNAESDYDWSNKNYVWTDIEDWRPEGGRKKRINSQRWGNTGLGWFIYWMQNIPGKDNRITYKGKPLRNWWIFIGDFDYAMKNRLKLVGE